MLINSRFAKGTRQRGITLIELLVFIIIVSVAIVGVLSVLNLTVRHSADPLVRKQVLALAESILSEIEQQPFTYCDPNDANAATAATTAGCTGGAANSQDKGGGAFSGPTPNTESRYSPTNPFDNVSDYGGFAMPGGGCTGICLPGDPTPLVGLTGYTVAVTITRVGGTAQFPTLPLAAALQINVTVTGPGNTTITLTGFRTRYAPNI
jgi:MSHA pilin protein MshD